MKIIDCLEDKRNVIRFFLGENDLEEWYGDDWDDAPYEHNAEEVYERFIKGVLDVFLPWECCVLFPCDGADNSPYSKEDMVKRRIPCAIIVPKEEYEYEWEVWKFEDYKGNDNVMKIYYGDKLKETWDKIVDLGGFCKAKAYEPEADENVEE